MPVSLADRLRERIRREGPITFHDWMQAALYDPEGGYYRRPDRKRWGREGDYRTSPERSQLFAATFGRYFAKLSEALNELTIVECGAGDGSFAAGVLCALRDQFPSVFAITRYVVFESSDDAGRRAQQRLTEFSDRVQFCSDWDSVSVKSGIIFSNELLDAFPVHRVMRTTDGLGELYVAVDAKGKFVWANGAVSSPRLTEFLNEQSLPLANGQIVEISLAVNDWLAQVSHNLQCGYLITVDYGAEARELYDFARRPTGTLRGFSRHAFVDDVLTEPGAYDLTSTVNWTQIKTIGQRLGLELIEFSSQDKFLLRAGVLDQLQYLLSKADTEAEKVALSTSAREMILPGGMASSFQVLVQKVSSAAAPRRNGKTG